MEDTKDKQNTIIQQPAQDAPAISPEEKMNQDAFNDLLHA